MLAIYVIYVTVPHLFQGLHRRQNDPGRVQAVRVRHRHPAVVRQLLRTVLPPEVADAVFAVAVENPGKLFPLPGYSSPSTPAINERTTVDHK